VCGSFTAHSFFEHREKETDAALPLLLSPPFPPAQTDAC
jgi:hypothetical protein